MFYSITLYSILQDFYDAAELKNIIFFLSFTLMSCEGAAVGVAVTVTRPLVTTSTTIASQIHLRRSLKQVFYFGISQVFLQSQSE